MSFFPWSVWLEVCQFYWSYPLIMRFLCSLIFFFFFSILLISVYFKFDLLFFWFLKVEAESIDLGLFMFSSYELFFSAIKISTVLAASHRFWYIVFLFSFSSNSFSFPFDFLKWAIFTFLDYLEVCYLVSKCLVVFQISFCFWFLF